MFGFKDSIFLKCYSSKDISMIPAYDADSHIGWPKALKQPA